MRLQCKTFFYGPICSSVLRSKAKNKAVVYFSVLQCNSNEAFCFIHSLSNVHPNITKQEGSLGLNLSNNTHRCSNCLLR